MPSILPLAALLPDAVNRHLGWWLFGIILVAGVAVGLKDIARLNLHGLRRVRAISSVSFRESIRRRVLWITPLAILGVIVVSQLQRPLDEQDAVRQTIKFCLFATGLIVAVTTIILACTNLPREIENRVIYTVVTKPTTRLEIVLGKVLGFAKISLLILLIMGAFTWAYLGLRASAMQRDIAQRLQSGVVPASSVATLKYYQDAGLLSAKTLETADGLQMFARLPDGASPRRYFPGGGEGSFLVPFTVDPEQLRPSPGGEPGESGLLIQAYIGYVRTGAVTPPPASAEPASTAPATAPATSNPTAAQATTAPTSKPYYGPFIMSPEERQKVMAGNRPAQRPTVSIEVDDANQNTIGQAVPIPPLKTIELGPPDTITEVRAIVDPKVAKQLKGRVYIRVIGQDPAANYFVDLAQTPAPANLLAPKLGEGGQALPPLAVPPLPDPSDESKPHPPSFQTRAGTFGQQLRGGPKDTPVGIYSFRDADIRAGSGGTVPFELKSGIERSGADERPDEAVDPTQVAVRVHNRTTGQTSDEIIVRPESNRTIFFTVPAEALSGGNFDVLLRCLTLGDFVGLQNRSLVLVTSRQSFAWNLTKSLLILWLMAILVTTVAIFTSTFLSWPIAVVLTLVILLGHWGVQQLGDATAPGVGAQVVTDFGLKNPAKAEAVRRTVENLSSFLNFISTILPDISKYPAVEDIERGVAVPMVKLRDAAAVTLGFGLPLVLLAYVFLKNKEVAP